MRTLLDAVVVGSGPNGLAAATLLAQEGFRVRVYEAAPTIGGGARSAALTLPGFVHDVCSAIHPLGVASPFLCSLPLEEHGLEWVHPPAPLAHPFDGGRAAILEREPGRTAETLGRDGAAWRRLVEPLVEDWERVAPDLLGPPRMPRHPLALARFGWLASSSARWLVESRFTDPLARGLFAGLAAHSMLPLERMLSSAAGLLLAILAHVAGWPFPRGGAQRIPDALGSYFRSLGGEIVTDRPIRSLDDLPRARAVLLDLVPREVLRIAGERLRGRYRRQLERYRYGPAAFKLDWALDGPIPWSATECGRAGTVHLGGTMEEIADSERAPWAGRAASRPFVLLAQQSLFDPSRAPAGRQAAWGYCHVPNGSAAEMTDRIEGQVERFAPGFRDRILARHILDPAALEASNPNYVGGDISGGVQDVGQVFARPVPRIDPYGTPIEGVYLCSSATPPGGGVHGMCGYHAARSALRKSLGVR